MTRLFCIGWWGSKDDRTVCPGAMNKNNPKGLFAAIYGK
jgi:hypothetical protein